MLTTLIISVIGVVIGTVGLTLSVSNYLRDRAVVKVFLKWDMTLTPGAIFAGQVYDHRKPWGFVRVTNIGRRPVYISAAALEYSATFYERLLHRILKRQPTNAFTAIIMGSLSGAKLAEGDSPQVFLISQDGMEQHKEYWSSVRVFVEDSAGKKYLSAPINACPS